MSTKIAPELDQEASVAWRTLSETVFGGGGLRVNAETLGAVRSLELGTRDMLLEGRGYDERTIDIPGPSGSMALSVFTPDAGAPSSLGVFWIHGGGMVAGNRWGASEALELGSAFDAVVTSIEYRLAPEHPAPAPVDDCYAGLLWFAEHASEFGVERIILGGTSAGGGIAASTALRVRDEGGPRLAGLVLCCPMLDDRMITCSSDQFGEDLVWTKANNEFGWRSLLGERVASDDVSIYEAPGRATDLSGLPPTLIDVGSADLFRDEDVAFASTIWASGGDAELHVWPGGYHGYELLAPAAPISVATFDARRRWVERTIARPTAHHS